MARAIHINHVTLIVGDLEAASRFYEEELGLQRLPAFELDFPAQFYRVNDTQQLHLTEWEDSTSNRGHVCMQVEDFNAIFFRMKELGCIDIPPWGRVRRLPDGAMQMFIRDPSGNLIEISCLPETPIDPAIFEDELVEKQQGLFKSGRDDSRGTRGDDASLFHD